MPGFLDPSDLIGDARGGMLDPSSVFDSPEYRRAQLWDTLGNLSAALIQAGAPSPYPRSPLTAIAQGIGGNTGTEDRFLKRMMVQSQLAKSQQELANDKAWRDMFSGAGGAAPGASASTDAATWKGQPSAPAASPGVSGGAAPDQQAFLQMMMPHALEVSKATGLDPRLVLAQAALETGYGKAAPGNNYFGIKSHDQPGGQVLPTTEAGPGGMVPTQASFRTYADPGASARDYAEFLKTNARYQPVLSAQGLDAQIDAMGKSGYATDPQYGAKLRQIAQGLPQGQQVAQGDASGTPIAPAQAQSPQQAFRPQTMQDVIQTIPPGVRQMIGAMGRKEGMGVLMKYADPGSEAVLDTQSGQVVFVPKTMVGRDPRYAPVKGAELDIQRQQLANSQRKTDIDERNAEVTIGNDGRPIVNQTLLDARRGVSAAQGTDPGSKIKVELAQDAIKRNGEWQASGMKAQSAIGRLGQLQTLLDQVTTGKFKGTTTEVKAIAKGAGLDLEALGVKDDVAPAQAIVALTNLMALENRDPSTGAGMPGAMSDADRNYLQQASPSITKDPAGNKILIAIKKGDLQRQADVAKFAREYMQSKAFTDNPAGLEDYVAGKISAKDYYDPSVLPQQSIAPPGAIPPPPAGFSTPNQAGRPAPPAGFRIVQ